MVNIFRKLMIALLVAVAALPAVVAPAAVCDVQKAEAHQRMLEVAAQKKRR